MLLRVVDLETTGLPPDAAICQVGWCDVSHLAGDPHVGVPRSRLANPGRPIPPEARAIHHISDSDVADAEAPELYLRWLMGEAGSMTKPDAFVAHNAKFEREFFAGGDVPWICTRKIGMRLWPDAPNFQNQTLRYFLDLDSTYGFTRHRAEPVHQAGPDAYVTAYILARALSSQPVNTLIQWTNEPALLPGAIQFGKHKGTPWSKVDPSYLDWIVNKASEMDEDVKFTARHWLARRRSDDR
jgi:exodeoxyribonuclease X